MTEPDKTTTAIADAWNKKTEAAKSAPLRTRWWTNPYVIAKLNERICGQAIPGFSSGMQNLVRSRYGEHLPFGRGISVGGGVGNKEMSAIDAGLVEHMTIYEFSDVRIQSGRELAESRGLTDQVTFVNGDAFAAGYAAGSFDMVHWDNSLHHMLDVPAAVEWSDQMLRPGGLFYMYDFVGPSRFQWTQPMLDLATEVRRALPESYLVDPRNPDKMLAREFLTPPSIDGMIKADPSEAADSGRILESIRATFPGIEVLLTGGVVYAKAFNDVIHHLSSDPVDPILALGMLLDFEAADNGLTHYAAAIALK